MDLPPGLYWRNGQYVVKYKRAGRWTHASVGKSLAHAIEQHRSLRGIPDEPAQGATFGDIVDAWLEEQARLNKPRTVSCARSHASRWIQIIGRHQAAALVGKTQIDRYVERRRREGVSAPTINAGLRVLKAILRFAASDDVRLIERAPTVRLLRAPARKDVVPFSTHELARAMEHAEPRARLLLAIAASSGLRTGEILWLQWRDIEPDGTVHVRAKSYRYRSRGAWREIHWSPKSHQARTVALPPDAMAELEAFRAQQRRTDGHDWVFQSTRGVGRMWARGSEKALRAAFQAAGCYERGKLVHAVRHSFASSAAEAGVDLETLRRILGHGALSTTALYLHSSKRQIHAAAALGSLLRRA